MRKIINHLKENWVRHGFETLVVVGGILVAFGLNNWNENRKQRSVEHELLMDLKRDLERNHTLLSTEWNEDARTACLRILEMMENKEPYHDSLRIYFHQMRIFPDPNISTSAYEALKNRGFDNIRSKELRNAIINLYEMSGRIMVARMERIYKARIPDFQTYINKNFFKDAVSNSILRPNDYTSVMADQHFANMLSHNAGFHEYCINMKTSFLQENDEVLAMIEQELDLKE